MASNLDIAALRERYRQLLGDGATERWHDFGDQRYEASYAFSMKGADWKLAAVAVNALPALLHAVDGRRQPPNDGGASTHDLEHPHDCEELQRCSVENERLRAQRDALLAALEPIVWQLESAQRSTAPAFFKGFTMNDTESGALLRAIAAAKKETP